MLDLLWNKYWVSTLSASPLLSNRDFAVGQVSWWLSACRNWVVSLILKENCKGP